MVGPRPTEVAVVQRAAIRAASAGDGPITMLRGRPRDGPGAGLPDRAPPNGCCSESAGDSRARARVLLSVAS